MFRKDSHEKLEFSVNDLVREVLKLIHGDLERRQIILQTELHDALPKITGERLPLQQVLFNLIMNAIEAMSAVTERERQLMIRAVLNERTNVKITVGDTGSGIDPAHIDRIFDPFFTTKSTGWAWAFPSAAQSSKRMAANFGHCHRVPLERASF